MQASYRNNANDTITIYNNNVSIATISNPITEPLISFTFLPNIPINVVLDSGPSPSTIYELPRISLIARASQNINITDVSLTEDAPTFAVDLSRYFGDYYNVSVLSGYTLEVSMIFDEKKSNEYDTYELYDGTNYVGT